MKSENNMKKIIFLLTPFFLIQGCASDRILYLKPNVQPGEFERANYECLQQVQQPESSFNGFFDAFGGSSTGSSGMRTNNFLYNACMEAKGFKAVRESQVRAYYQKKQQEIGEKFKQEREKTASLRKNMEHRLAEISKGQTTFMVNNLSSSDLENQNRPTKAEAKEISELFTKNRELYIQAVDKYPEIYPNEILQVVRSNSKEKQLLFNSFGKGELSYGEFNRKLKEQSAKLLSEIKNITQRQ